jgi:AsmA family.
VHLENVKLAIGKVDAAGDVHVKLGGPKPVFDVRVTAGEVEWSRLLEDTGGQVHHGVPEGEILPATPMGWRAIAALKGKKGTLDAQVARVKLGNGLTLGNVKTRMSFEDDRLDVASFATEMLGGNATFRARLEGAAQRGHLEMDGRNLLLERWFKERGKKIPFEGGPMQIKASLDAKGESMKDLAANMTGPVTIRMGRGVYASEKAGEVESMLSTASGGAGQKGIHFECAAAKLPFRSGRADEGASVGAASRVSYLLTTGGIDFRGQKLDLHGRLKPRSGIALATLAGDVKIFGSMAKPQIAIDHAPAMARIGAAIATAGITAAATALADAATTENPCEAVFSSR